jgi:branched-chain amino acid transport system ATP-binding protein
MHYKWKTEESEGSMLLEVQNLTKFFGGVCAVNGLSFGVNDGILGIIGPNGSGKTTTFNLIAGVYKPTRGVVTFNGKQITGQPSYKVCKLGIARTFQLIKIFGSMSVFENVLVGATFGRQRSQVTREATLDVLKSTGLADKAESSMSTLTLLDKKRLEIARALATKPRLLMLDEPAGGLSPAEVDDLMRLIREIAKGGVAVLLIEHVMKAAMGISDRMIVLNEGKKIAEGSPDEVARSQEVIDAYLGEVIA